MRQKMTVMNFDFGQGGKGSKIGFLPLWLSGVMWAGADPGCKISDFVDVVFWKLALNEPVQIQPFVLRALEASIV